MKHVKIWNWQKDYGDEKNKRMEKKATKKELLALREEMCGKMIEHYKKVQEAQKQMEYHSEQIEELRMNLIKSIVGDVEQCDCVAIRVNCKYYEGMLMDTTVHVLSYAVGFAIKDGKTNRYVKCKLGEDDFKIEKIV